MPVPVATSLQSFSQGWLGQFSSNPTLDGYGNAVVAGAQYYNTVTNQIMIYGGTSWAVYNPGLALAAANSATLAQNYASQAASSSAYSQQYATNSSNSANASATSATSSATSATSAAASAAAAALIESSVNGIVYVPLTNANVNLTTVQFNNAIIVFTGTITANIIVTVPVSSHTFIAANSTTGPYTLTLGMVGGTATIQVPQSKANSLYCDGTTGIYATSSVSGLQFSGTNFVGTTGTTLTSSYAGTRTALETANMSTTLPSGSTLQSGAAIYLDNQTSGTQIIHTNGSDTLDIGTPLTMNPYDKFLLSWDGTEWRTALYSNFLNPIFSQGLGLSNGYITVTNTASGAGLKIIGTSSATPNKTISVVGGSLNILNNAGTTSILSLSDTGNLQAVGGIDTTIIGANTPAAGSFTNLVSSVFTANASGTFNGTVSITNSAISPALTITDTNTSGAQIKFVGSGAVTPNKTISITSGLFEVLNSAASSAILTLSDAGDLRVANIDAAIIGASIPAAGTFTTATVTTNVTFPDGTHQTTANGTTAPVSTVYSPSIGTTTITTAGYTPGFVQVYQNGVRLVVNNDFTATDSVHINLTAPSGLGDTYEVLTAVIYSPQTAMTPSDTVYTLAAGTSTFTVSNYNIGFVDVFLNGSKLVGGQDFSATTGNSITLIGFTAEATDQFDVKIWSTYTPANALNGTNPTIISGGLTFADGTQQGSAAAGRNRIINGSCVIAQRAATSFTAGTTGYGGPDRFCAQNGGSTGGVFSQSVQGFSVPGQGTGLCVNQSVTTVPTSLSGSNYFLGIDQRIEGFNCYDLVGQQVTVSFWFQSNVVGTYSIRLSDYTGTHSCVTTFTYSTASTPQYVTYTFPTLPTSLTVPCSSAGGLEFAVGMLNTGTFATSTLNSWISGNYACASTATNWASTIGNYIGLTNLQLEAGTVATPFERKNIQDVVAECYRYYQLINSSGASFSGATNGVAITIPLPVPMRTASPTTYTNLTAAAYVATAPSATQWTMLLQGIAYCSISSGTMSIIPQAGLQMFQLLVEGVTLSVMPNNWTYGSSSYFAVQSEL